MTTTRHESVTAGPDSAPWVGVDVSKVPQEEIRFAVVLNGGVSLAVWMGGVVVELDRLTRGDGPYEHILGLIAGSARVDIIAGTSAGGINGAALALAQVNASARLMSLRDIWADQGRMESLLRQPFRGSPASLLKGDEFFLPQLRDAFRRLAEPFKARPADQRPIDLTITTTLLRGASSFTVDSLGQKLSQSVHEGRFHFRRAPGDDAASDGDFAATNILQTADRLALAARCTASFPLAFEPSFVPVDCAATGGDDGQPRQNMAAVASWSDKAAKPVDRSRFAVDGGVLVNTPTRQALEAVGRMPAEGLVSRVMLLVYPHAVLEEADQADTADHAPTVARGMSSLLGAVLSQGSRTFVDEIERHNRLTASRRASRADLLASLTKPDDKRASGRAHGNQARVLEATAVALFPSYRQLRIRRAARDLPTRAPAAEKWPYERIRSAAEVAQSTWEAQGGVPYVPAACPPSGVGELGADGSGWPWGVTTADHLAEAVLDLLRRLIWILPEGDDLAAVKGFRKELHAVRGSLREHRAKIDDPWASRPELVGLTPDQRYWSLRLAAYQHAMLPEAAGMPVDVPKDLAWDAAISTHGERGAVGEAVRTSANQIITIAVKVADLLQKVPATDVEKSQLSSWCSLLVAEPTEGEREACLEKRHEQVFSRLLNLEIVTTCLGEETETGAVLPVELAQISLQARNDFARFSRTADDKSAGMAIHRFSGFLKQSWRLNDWTWGRMDAATMLCRILLRPARLRRIYELMNGIDHRFAAEQEVRRLVRTLLGPAMATAVFGDEPTVDQRLRNAVHGAVTELADAFNPDCELNDLSPEMPCLATLAAWGVHLRIANEELPAVARAVRADGVEGAGRSSRGELFLKANKVLLDELDRLPMEVPTEAVNSTGQTELDRRVDLGLKALDAFDRAGIGREALAEEGTSDQMIRTATTAAAVAVTLADSDASGVPAVRPVTRSLRGAALLPYWAILGLTRGGSMARFLALLGLAVGGMLTALALLAPLPSWAAGSAAAIGAGALLGTFGYAAMRTGTLLHGIVLLTPVLPLVVYAATRPGADNTKGISTVLVVAALATGLIILGSIPAPVSGPVSTLKRNWKPMLLTVIGLAVAASVAAGAVWLAAHLTAVDWRDRDIRLATAGIALVAVLLGGCAAWWWGRRLRPWQREGISWRLGEVFHPAVSTAGWSVLYGSTYLALAAFLLFGPAAGDIDQLWVRVAVLTGAVIAAILLLFVPWYLPRRAIRRQIDRFVNLTTVGDYVNPMHSVVPQPKAIAEQLPVRLIDRGLGYRYLIAPGPNRPPAGVHAPPSGPTGTFDEKGLVLTDAGKKIVDRIRARLECLLATRP